MPERQRVKQLAVRLSKQELENIDLAVLSSGKTKRDFILTAVDFYLRQCLPESPPVIDRPDQKIWLYNSETEKRWRKLINAE
jgi:hypothetical protein